MAPVTVNQDLSVSQMQVLIENSKLLSAAELQVLASLPSDSTAALVDSILHSNLLTEFQLEAIVRGDAASLRLGNYELLDKLGAGGMGTVYKARHRRMKRIVAVKVLARNLCDDLSFIRRFQREVETIAQLSHPNIVMAFDADESPNGHFLVMEYVHGQDLATIVQRQGPMPAPIALDSIIQAARGLEYVHAQKMIHRDIKPANLLRDVSGVVKVTDLGLARLSANASGARNSLTQAGGVLGTVDYMPPEQAMDSTQIDHRADIYSLGCTLFFLLAGAPPYLGKTILESLLLHRDAPIPSVAAVRGDVPPPFDGLLRKLMAKSAADRPPTMTDVVRQLSALQDELSRQSPDLQVSAPVFMQLNPRTEVVSSLRAPAEQQNSPTIALTPGSTATGMPPPFKILLVEPSRTQAGIIRRYLAAQDLHQVVVVGSGSDALQMLASDPPHVIISTMHLSDMSGLDLLTKVRASKLLQPGFVIISTESEEADVGTLSKYVPAHLLHKPFTAEKLLEAVSLVSKRKLVYKPVTGESDSAVLAMKAGKPGVSAEAALRRGALQVLIADDSAAARLHERQVLSELGFKNFVEVPDGAQAVAAIARQTFDLIVTDYNMPHMDGRALVGYLKANRVTTSLPILMVTTETDPAKLEAVRQLGVAGVCAKQFTSEAVRALIDRLF